MAKTATEKIKIKQTTTRVKWYDNFKNILFICLGCLLIYSIYYFEKVKFDDSSLLGGDEWEYQAIAVNYVTGHGFPVFGCAEPFEKYKMNKAWNSNWWNYYHNEFLKEKVDYRFYRTPGYPFYLGIVYKVFGISPKKAKQSQLFLQIIIASFLPLLGFIYWRRAGIIGGLIAAPLFLNKYCDSANELMTESLIMFMIFLILFSFILYEKKRNIYTAITFGIVLGLSPLIKGSLIYIPVLFSAYLVYELLKKQKKILYVVVPIALFPLTILPWSLYASSKSDKTIVLSTQGDYIMLEGNNEATFTDGGWHPEAVRNNPKSFYSKPEIKDLPTTQKLISFYKENSDKIPIVIKNKLVSGLEEFSYLKSSLILIISELFFIIIQFFLKRNQINNKNETIWRISSLIVAALAGLIFFKIIFLLAVTILLTMIILPTGNLSEIKMPVSFAIIFLNFLLIIIVILGLPRYIYVMDYLFMLTTVTYILLNIEYWFLQKSKKVLLPQKKNK